MQQIQGKGACAAKFNLPVQTGRRTKRGIGTSTYVTVECQYPPCFDVFYVPLFFRRDGLDKRPSTASRQTASGLRSGHRIQEEAKESKRDSLCDQSFELFDKLIVPLDRSLGKLANDGKLAQAEYAITHFPLLYTTHRPRTPFTSCEIRRRNRKVARIANRFAIISIRKAF